MDLALAEAGDYMAVSHKMHCLGQIRQYITCHADLTPMPSFFGRGYPDQTTPHTCRNFDKIRDWVWERHNGSIAVPPDYTRKP
jgi:Mycotoxin biosynthesis protein UstYa